ncbi:hypothetical protein [Rhodothermus bifroesti]|uniref:Uncharacterized protein n=1 Tax=Rhodothermus marinus TaxID=29549 RepID=A0A7V2F5M2_RHOMR|nr:hypothetical protein [Rhodothermus bifroesti]GBD02479.1 hypothetical protein HRbin18_02221 [bacterium HR18]
MWFIFDNLNALIVGGMLFLMMLTVQQRLAEINLEQTVNYMVKRQAGDLATWLEDDLLRLGRGVDWSSETPFENPVDSAGVTVRFVFFHDSTDAAGNALRVYVRYRLQAAGHRVIRNDSVSVYRLQREECIGSSCPTGPWQASGESPGLLSYFKIDLLDRDARPIADPKNNAALVQNTRVRFTMAAPFEVARAQVLRQVYYGSTLLIDRYAGRSGGS